MLPARAAEALQHIAGHVVAARDRDLLDRIGHIVDRDADEALRHLLGALAGPRGDLRAARPRRLGVDRLIAVRPEDMREMLRP